MEQKAPLSLNRKSSKQRYRRLIQYHQTKTKLGNLESRFIELTNEGRTIVRDCSQLMKDLDNLKTTFTHGFENICVLFYNLFAPNQNLFIQKKPRERSSLD